MTPVISFHDVKHIRITNTRKLGKEDVPEFWTRAIVLTDVDGTEFEIPLFTHEGADALEPK